MTSAHGNGGGLKRKDYEKELSSLHVEPVELPKRQKPHGYQEPRYPYKYVEERF